MTSSKIQGFIVGILIVAIVGMGALVAVGLFSARSEEDTPRTALERMIFDATLAVKQSPGALQPRVDLATALASGGNYKAAIDQLDAAQKIEPADAEVKRLKGAVYARMGDRDQAIRWLKEAAASEDQLADFYADVYADMAKVYEDANDYKSAIKAYKEALKNSPISTVLLRGLAQVYEKSGDLEKAKIAYEDAYAMDTQDAETRANIKRLEQAIKVAGEKKK